MPTYFHGTNAELQPGEVIVPGWELGRDPNYDSDYYDQGVVYLTTGDHLAERYAVGVAGRKGGEPHVYEVEPLSEVWPDKEQETGWSSDQFMTGKARVLREVPLPGLVTWNAETGSLWRKTADYQGWTNWDTWHLKLMMDNERDLHDRSRQIVEQGMRAGQSDSQIGETLAQWAIVTILGPHNKQAIEDAQEWNDIPMEERIDPHLEELRRENPSAADAVEHLMGPNIGDTDPMTMDEMAINWPEIVASIKDDILENWRYEQGHDWRSEAMPDWYQEQPLTLPEHWSRVAAQEDSEMWYDAGAGQRFRVPMPSLPKGLSENAPVQDDTEMWVLVKDKVAFGPKNRLDNLAFKLAQDVRLDNMASMRIRNKMMLGQLDPVTHMAYGEMRDGYPIIHATNVDRNWVYDQVMTRAQNRKTASEGFYPEWEGPTEEPYADLEAFAREGQERGYDYSDILFNLTLRAKRKLRLSDRDAEIVAQAIIEKVNDVEIEWPSSQRDELLRAWGQPTGELWPDTLPWSEEEQHYYRTADWVPTGDFVFQEGDRVQVPSGGRGTVRFIEPPPEDYVPEECEACGSPTENNLSASGRCNDCGNLPHEHDPTTWVRIRMDDGGQVQAPAHALKFEQGMESALMPDTIPWSEDEQQYYRTSAISPVDPVRYRFEPFTPEELASASRSGMFSGHANTLNARARRNKRLVPGKVRPQELMALWNRYEGRCAYCGQAGADTFDHVVPIVDGGPNTIDNLLPAHSQCNHELNEWDQSRRDYTPQRWRKSLPEEFQPAASIVDPTESALYQHRRSLASHVRVIE